MAMKMVCNVVAKTLEKSGCGRLCRRGFSSDSSSSSCSHPKFTIWSACEGGYPGKTLVAAGLASTVVESAERSHMHYIKPLQTSYPAMCDSRLIYDAVTLKFQDLAAEYEDEYGLLSSNRVADPPLAVARGTYGETQEVNVNKKVALDKARKLICETLYIWRDRDYGDDGGAVEDQDLLNNLHNCCFQQHSHSSPAAPECCWTLIETHATFATPAPSGTLQCDLYRPFCGVPAILVGDGNRCGISATISAYESLTLRGYDVVAVVQEDCDYPFSRSYLPNGLPVVVLPTVPDDLISWFMESRDEFASLKQILLSAFYKRREGNQEISYEIKENSLKGEYKFSY